MKARAREEGRRRKVTVDFLLLTFPFRNKNKKLFFSSVQAFLYLSIRLLKLSLIMHNGIVETCGL
jgi:hypothetical protein